MLLLPRNIDCPLLLDDSVVAIDPLHAELVFLGSAVGVKSTGLGLEARRPLSHACQHRRRCKLVFMEASRALPRPVSPCQRPGLTGQSGNPPPSAAASPKPLCPPSRACPPANVVLGCAAHRPRSGRRRCQRSNGPAPASHARKPETGRSPGRRPPGVAVGRGVRAELRPVGHPVPSPWESVGRPWGAVVASSGACPRRMARSCTAHQCAGPTGLA